MNLVAIALFIIMVVIFTKFNLVCEVTINGEKLGYIINKEKFEQSINKIIDETNGIEYHLIFANRTEKTNDEAILAKIKADVEDKNKTEVVQVAKAVDTKSKTAGAKTKTTTKKVATASKKKVTSRGSAVTSKTTSNSTSSKKETNSTTSKKETKTISSKTTSKITTTAKKTTKVPSLNGVEFTVKPVSGVITSRFGGRWGRQHTGLDIGAPKGTKIKAAAGGTVIFAGYSGAYGNVVKISHGSGIKTYYAHCSKLYVKKGQKVSAGDVIAAVGSTGRSTGNHLHFEVVKNGTSINPQNYLYK